MVTPLLEFTEPVSSYNEVIHEHYQPCESPSQFHQALLGSKKTYHRQASVLALCFLRKEEGEGTVRRMIVNQIIACKSVSLLIPFNLLTHTHLLPACNWQSLGCCMYCVRVVISTFDLKPLDNKIPKHDNPSIIGVSE